VEYFLGFTLLCTQTQWPAIRLHVVGDVQHNEGSRQTALQPPGNIVPELGGSYYVQGSHGAHAADSYNENFYAIGGVHIYWVFKRSACLKGQAVIRRKDWSCKDVFLVN
jgi:hypothetical protein